MGRYTELLPLEYVNSFDKALACIQALDKPEYNSDEWVMATGSESARNSDLSIWFDRREVRRRRCQSRSLLESHLRLSP